MTKSDLKLGNCWAGVLLVFLVLTLAGCVSSMDPKNVDVQLKESQPTVKLTSYTETLRDLGLMTEIYDTGELRIQSDPVGDNTGTSMSTGGEIPRDITEILKSTLNSIGGNVRYIPYDPVYIQNMAATGYSNFTEKIAPEVVVSGGITEFDRGLETRGDGTDVGVDATFTNAPKWTPSGSVGLNYGDAGKEGTARITLDFNMLDFKTMAGIPRMNTVNSMEVYKGLREREFGITLFGPTFGRKGSIKKVQGRHAAVRVLVEVSMIQMVGKYLALPYWKLIGEDAQADPVVKKQIERYYYSISDPERISAAQQWAYLYGFDIGLDGSIDVPTRAAFQSIDPSFPANAQTIGFDTFLAIYVNIPIKERTLARRNLLTQVLASTGGVSNQTQAAPAPQPPAPPAPKAQASETANVSPPSTGTKKQASQAKPVIKAGAGIGRMLSDEEW